MNWLLSLFPQWVTAQAQIAALEEKCRLLEQQAKSAEARVDDIRRVADAYARQATGRSVFHGMTDLTPPSVEAPRPVMGTRKLGREMQMESMTAFYKSLLSDDGNQAA